MKPRHLPPELLERLVAHLIGARELERLDVRLPGDQQRVAVGAEADRDDFGHPDTGLRGHQRRERLVLDLLAAARPARSAAGRGRRGAASDGRAAGCPARPDRARAPSAGRLRVVPDVLRRADPLPLGDPAGRPPRPRARRAQRAPAPSAARRPRIRTRSRTSAPAPRPSARPPSAPTAARPRARRRRAPPAGRATWRARRTGRTSSGPATATTAVAAREAQLGESPARQQMRPRSEASRTRRRGRGRMPSADHDEERRQQIARQEPSAGAAGRRRRSPARARARPRTTTRQSAARPPQHRDQRLRDAPRPRREPTERSPLPGRRRSPPRCEEHAVDRPPVPATRLRRREQRGLSGAGTRHGPIVPCRGCPGRQCDIGSAGLPPSRYVRAARVPRRLSPAQRRAPRTRPH